MAKIIRDYLDIEHIGKVIELTVWNGTRVDRRLVGRLIAYAESGSKFVAQFAGGDDSRIIWDKEDEFTVSYDPDRIR